MNHTAPHTGRKAETLNAPSSSMPVELRRIQAKRAPARMDTTSASEKKSCQIQENTVALNETPEEILDLVRALARQAARDSWNERQ